MGTVIRGVVSFIFQKAHEHYPVKELFPRAKYAQLSSEQTILGLNDLGFMTLDPRLPKEKVVDNKSFFYKSSTKPQLTCAATTGSGHMAVGSKNGDIRLYSEKTLQQSKKDLEQAPRAKTQLPGLGGELNLYRVAYWIRSGDRYRCNGRWPMDTCNLQNLFIADSCCNTWH